MGVWESMREILQTHELQWRIQDFLEGAPTFYLTNFSRKRHENEHILDQRGDVPRAPLDPPLIRESKNSRELGKQQRISGLTYVAGLNMCVLVFLWP